jgi:hypothetical protein
MMVSTHSPQRDSLPITRQVQEPLHWPSILQFVFTVLALFGLWGSALGIGVIGLIESSEAALSLFLIAAGLILSGLLLVPSLAFTGLRLAGRPAKEGQHLGLLRPTLLIFALPLILLAGNWSANQTGIGRLILPVVHVLAIGLPVWWIAYLALRNLTLGSPQRRWGVFTSGLIVGPALILVIETLALIVFVLIAVLVISTQPDLLNEWLRLSRNLRGLQTSPQDALNALGPYMNRPGIIFAVLAFGAGIVPLIEEAIKPVGVWLLAGRNLTPAAGFAAGTLSGAGYALFESLALSSTTNDWLYLVVARIGTAAVHVLTSALTGWALVLAWREKRYLRLGAVYLLAVLIHASWNGMSLLASFGAFSDGSAENTLVPLLGWLNENISYGLGLLTIACFAALLLANHRLAKTGYPTPIEQPGYPDNDPTGGELDRDAPETPPENQPSQEQDRF